MFFLKYVEIFTELRKGKEIFGFITSNRTAQSLVVFDITETLFIQDKK